MLMAQFLAMANVCVLGLLFSNGGIFRLLYESKSKCQRRPKGSKQVNFTQSW